MTVLLGTGVATASADTGTDLPQEQIAAIGDAGTVYLSGTWTGFVNYPTADGSYSWSDQIDAGFSCSGFVASPDGYIVTAGHCADVAEGKSAIVDQFLANEVAKGTITDADVTSFISGGAEANWPVEGQTTGSSPELAMQVYPAISITGSNAAGYAGVLVDDRPISQGDTALFKIDTTSPLPVLLVSANQPTTGQTVNAIGYPGNVTALVSGNPQPTFSKGEVSGRQQTAGGPFTQIGITMSPGMSGGPVVNGQGDVVGTVSFGPSNDTQQLNFATAQDTIAAMLARNGVKNTLSDIDQSYRKGLNEYFNGQYHAAATDLGNVVTRQPSNAIAQQYQSKAIAAYPQENTNGWVIWLIVGAVIVLVIVLVVVVLLVLLRGRRRRNAAASPSGVTGTDFTGAGAQQPAHYPPAATAYAAAPTGAYATEPAPPATYQAAPAMAPTTAVYPTLAEPLPAAPQVPAVAPSSDASNSATAVGFKPNPTDARTDESPGSPLPAESITAESNTAESNTAVSEFMYCSNCGAKNKPDAHFCPSCGHAVGA
ncbi:trypsin-like peptidase domain-containing protein [Subtercola frigoramans]|uniref:S1-C subfamily serine protease/ribosomal protein L40E n=1 Tax=Subtercola frigoramans TaxID=120298 RepID=A0ABS2L3J3_9MICO|nr:trypsin-like peptidase domain-containing protein [Subtercola frigoramans]MBM7471637.1 S1-C subfamily serine protease/ribosomal protein L40E [Subtercola frigoramans]